MEAKAAFPLIISSVSRSNSLLGHRATYLEDLAIAICPDVPHVRRPTRPSPMCSALHLLFRFPLLMPEGQIKLSAQQAHRRAQQPFHMNTPLNPATFTAIYHLGHTHTHARMYRVYSENGPSHLNKPVCPLPTFHFSLNAFRSVGSRLIIEAALITPRKLLYSLNMYYYLESELGIDSVFPISV